MTKTLIEIKNCNLKANKPANDSSMAPLKNFNIADSN